MTPAVHFSKTASMKSFSDPQTYARPQRPRACSRSNVHLHSCKVKEMFKDEPLISNAETKIQHDIAFLMDEIQKLTNENCRLKEDSCVKDFDYMNIIEQLDGKENEIEELRAELNQLSAQIALSNAKEEEYLNSARSCVSLESQVRVLEEKLAQHRRDFERLSTVHASCPTIEELNAAVENTKASYRQQLTEVHEQMGQREKQITALEDRIARKDVELQKISLELTQTRSGYNLVQERCNHVEGKLKETEHLVEDRERLIDNMKLLMTRKSVKINLLLLRIHELEVKLKLCTQELRGAKTTQSSPPGYLHKDEQEMESLRKVWCRGNGGWSHDRGGHFKHHDTGGEGDTMTLWEELSAVQNSAVRVTAVDEVLELDHKINNIKTKIHCKMEKEIARGK